jgi:hypothetical protein
MWVKFEMGTTTSKFRCELEGGFFGNTSNFQMKLLVRGPPSYSWLFRHFKILYGRIFGNDNAAGILMRFRITS